MTRKGRRNTRRRGFFQEKEVVIELGKEWKEKDERKNKENGSKTGKE